jgi:hypothetical protein
MAGKVMAIVMMVIMFVVVIGMVVTAVDQMASQINISGAKNVNAKIELVLEQRCLVFHAQGFVITLIGNRTHTVMMVTTIVVVIGTVAIAVEMLSPQHTALNANAWILILPAMFLAMVNVRIRFGLEIAIVMMEIICAVVTGTMVIAVETIMFTINALIVHARTRMQWSILPLMKTLKSFYQEVMLPKKLLLEASQQQLMMAPTLVVLLEV